MIDDKKIEDAAKQHSEESYISDYFQACYKDAFMECAKWVQEEFQSFTKINLKLKNEALLRN